MIEDFTNMVEKSLNLSEPWYVKGTEFHPEEPAIHIFLDIKNGRKFSARNAAEKRRDMATSRTSAFGGMGRKGGQ